MTPIPEFPESRDVLLRDKPIFDQIFALNPPDISAYTFTNILAWREAHGLSVSRIGEHLLICHDSDGLRVCWEPLGAQNPVPTMEEAFRRSDEVPMEFERVSTRTVASLADHASMVTKPDPDNWDYVYSTADLIDLPGRKFDAKRNFIKRMKSQTDYEYIEINGETARECQEFAHSWCEERKCHTVEGLRREQCATYEILSNFDELEVRGGAVKMNGAIVAFSVGEPLNPETFVIHLEKADSSISGLYQLMNNEFCIHEAREFRYVNREQDLGVPGLRKAKESYHPVMMVETYRVTCGNP